MGIPITQGHQKDILSLAWKCLIELCKCDAHEHKHICMHTCSLALMHTKYKQDKLFELSF